MCSIMGYCGTVMTIKDFKTGFDKTVSRGPDMSRIIDTGKGLLGFHRLAIMGLDESGMQPFAFGGNYVVCNGEIYGFRKLKKELEEKGYKFSAIPTANCCCRCIRNTARICSECLTPNMR